MKGMFWKGILALVITYVILYSLYVTQSFLPAWDAYGLNILNGVPLEGFLFVDPLLWLLPLVGFSFMWIGLSHYIRYFKSESVLSIPFGLVYLISCYVIWFFTLIFYYWNNAFLIQQAQGDPSPFVSSFSPAVDFVMQSFNDSLLASAFFLFVLAGLFGWVSFVIIHNYFNKDHSLSLQS
jgi:hypothetical protein